jgi:uncharacterized protein YjbI with pentapeptide repeats
MPAALPHPTRPELPDDLPKATPDSLEHDATLAELELCDASLTDENARGVTFQSARMKRVDLSGSRLEHLRVTEAVLSACNLANVHARGAHLMTVLIQDSRLTGMALPQGELMDVTFKDCRIDLASFGSCRLERVSFEDCMLAQTDFLDAQLNGVRFDGCDLTTADIRGARLKRCELRGSDLTGLQGVESLRGAAMEWRDIIEMAGVWAAALGIEVLER